MILTHSSNFFPIILILAFCFDLNSCNLKGFLISKLNMVFEFQISLHSSFIFEDNHRYDWTLLYGGIASNPFSLTSTLRISGLFIISGWSFKLSMIKRIFIENEFIGISKVI